MKKTTMLGLFAIALLVMAIVPAAFAENGDNGNDTGTNETAGNGGHGRGGQGPLGGPRGQGIGEDVRGQLKQERETVRENVKQTREEVKEQVQQFREQTKEQLQQFRERAEELKKEYNKTRDAFKEQRDLIKDDREKFRECKNETNSTQCRDIHKKIQGEAKGFLENGADMVLSALNRVKANIEASEGLSAEQKAALIAKVDVQIQEITDAKTNASNLSENATAKEIRDAADGIRDSWKSTRPVITGAAADIVNARLGNIVVSVDQLSVKLHAARDKLAAAGKDTSGIDAKLADFDAKLALAKQEWQAALDTMTAGGENAPQAAHEHVVKAKGYLQQVRDLLREVVNEVRKGGPIDLGTNTTSNTTVNASA